MEWRIVTFAKLEDWRSKNRLPRTKAVKLLGVTIGTWYNWARGRSVPTVSVQKRLAEFIQQAPATIATKRTTRSAREGRNRGAAAGSAIAAASIVNAYVARSKGTLSTSEVLSFLEAVLATLARG